MIYEVTKHLERNIIFGMIPENAQLYESSCTISMYTKNTSASVTDASLCFMYKGISSFCGCNCDIDSMLHRSTF